jgi:hypothetical protein
MQRICSHGATSGRDAFQRLLAGKVVNFTTIFFGYGILTSWEGATIKVVADQFELKTVSFIAETIYELAECSEEFRTKLELTHVKICPSISQNLFSLI